VTSEHLISEAPVRAPAVRVATAGSEPGSSARFARSPDALPLVGLSVSAILWAVALFQLDTDAIGDFGLLDAFPTTMYVAFGLLVSSMILAVHRRATDRVLAAHVGLLVLMLHATPAIRYETLRYAWSWKHLGIVHELTTQHWIDGSGRDLAIYHNWPGFFSAAATWLGTAVDPRGWAGLAQWAPPAFQLLYALAAYAVLQNLTDDRRVVWLGVWLFAIANWIGQDYFAPQSMAFFLFLVTCALALRFASHPTTITRRPRERNSTAHAIGTPRGEPATEATRRATRLLVVALATAIVVTHPLTPFVLIAALVALTVTGVVRDRRLALYVMAVQVVWLFTGARGFSGDRGRDLLAGFGALRSNLDASLEDASRADAAQRLVSTAGRAEVALLVLLAAVGLWRRTRRGTWDVAAAVLIATPLVIIAANSYGGEATFRVYLFALPFLAFVAATAFAPDERAWRPITAVVALAVSGALLAATLFAYYGKEQWTHFTESEVRAAELVFDDAPTGSLIIEGTDNYPARFARVNDLVFLNLAAEPRASREEVVSDPAATIATWLDDRRYPDAYLIITASQRAEARSLGLFPAGGLDRIERELLTSPLVEVLYRDDDAVVFSRREITNG